VCEGWSLSKGKGYCSPGSKVVFERPKASKGGESESKSLMTGKEKLGPARLVNGKMVHAKGKVTAGKQMTLGQMMAKKATPAVRDPALMQPALRTNSPGKQEGNDQARGRSDHTIQVSPYVST
jgi:hypothetical protein